MFRMKITNSSQCYIHKYENLKKIIKLHFICARQYNFIFTFCIAIYINTALMPHLQKLTKSIYCIYNCILTACFEYRILTGFYVITLKTGCVTIVFSLWYIQSTVCHYHLTLYCLLFLCHYAHCCLLQSVHCLSVPYTVLSVVSVSLCTLLSSIVSLLSVSTSHCTVCCFCVTMHTAEFYSLSTVCQYLTLYCLLFLCHYAHCCLL